VLTELCSTSEGRLCWPRPGRALLWALVLPLGLVAYSLYLRATFGNALAFLEVQQA
jgi:hypothetical protein